MHRRDFLLATAAAGLCPSSSPPSRRSPPIKTTQAAAGLAIPSPREATKAPPEKLLYTIGLYVGTEVKKPDYLATIDVEQSSPTYSQVIHRLAMPYVGDELHHFGWNACSSCHGDASKSRRYLIVPGLRSSRIHIVDVANPRAEAAQGDRARNGEGQRPISRAAHGTLCARRADHDLDARRRRGQRPRRLSGTR